ncbi:hypothetical protein EJ02DRAFT_431069 [Clathrospora elynae]|uniref:Uncharacterized protein n=1 Tax=Clathrospora elynae TaxID=706981 RepID=A0A6A5T0L1_9PLEO|nr:hypothetical protein EJ02DRAFT_431069 [Clathrospora elynae]
MNPEYNSYAYYGEQLPPYEYYQGSELPGSSIQEFPDPFAIIPELYGHALAAELGTGADDIPINTLPQFEGANKWRNSTTEYGVGRLHPLPSTAGVTLSLNTDQYPLALPGMTSGDQSQKSSPISPFTPRSAVSSGTQHHSSSSFSNGIFSTSSQDYYDRSASIVHSRPEPMTHEANFYSAHSSFTNDFATHPQRSQQPFAAQHSVQDPGRPGHYSTDIPMSIWERDERLGWDHRPIYGANTRNTDSANYVNQTELPHHTGHQNERQQWPFIHGDPSYNASPQGHTPTTAGEDVDIPSVIP